MALFDFIGVGGLAYDMVLQVERLPLGDDKYPALPVEKLPGGFIANATCAAARLGLRASYIGWVGDDADGEMLIDDFIDWHVEPEGVVRLPGEMTPFTVVMTEPRGQRAIVIPRWPIYNAQLTYEQAALARQARVVYTYPRDPVWCAQLRRATLESGGELALDVESTVPMGGDELREAVAVADVVFVTKDSLAILGVSSIERLVQPGQWVILTDGRRGSSGIAAGMRKPVSQKAHPAVTVDTTGAGDCYHAALIAARLDGAELPEALAFASAAAAIKVEHRGARGGLPTRDEVELRLARP
jgi:sugar/nucleoside kinase (ribokinase family)